MNPDTLSALQGAILKWEHVVDGTGPECGAVNCPLCQAINPGCEGCAVDDATGEGCGNDEFMSWMDHIYEHPDTEKSTWAEFYVQCPECKTLAQAELDFLKSMLPKEEQ